MSILQEVSDAVKISWFAWSSIDRRLNFPEARDHSSEYTGYVALKRMVAGVKERMRRGSRSCSRA